MKTFTILGGGIAGLSAAIALQRIGIRARVYESAPEVKPVGAGLLLAANAVNAYRQIGIADAILDRGRLLPLFRILDRRGKTISVADAAVIGKKYGLHNFSIHRADLHDVLLSFLEARQVVTGKRASGIEPQADGRTTIRFSDGSSEATDYLIAADGIHSPIRQHFLPDAQPRYAGYTCWRAVIDDPGLTSGEATESWGTAGRFGIVPLAGNRIYWFACVNAPRDDPRMRAMPIEELQKIFGAFHRPIPEILAHTPNEALIWGDIIDLRPIPRFAFGNTLLIGDAAHATTPNLGQGACQAIEDAVVLAELLKGPQEPATAFRAFELQRLARTHFIVNTSWRLGKIAQTANPVLAGIRNALLRRVPDSINERQLKRVLETDFTELKYDDWKMKNGK